MLAHIQSAHAKVFAGGIVDDAAGVTTIKTSRGDNELGDVKGQETVAIETTGIALRQHKGLADNSLGIDMTEIGTCKKAVVATGTQDKPTRVGSPVVERFRIVGIGSSHGSALTCSEVEQIEVGLVVPDAELSVVGERIA